MFRLPVKIDKVKVATYLLLTTLGIFVWCFLSSAIFFTIAGISEHYLRPWSIIEYAINYHGYPVIQKKIILSAVIPPIIAIGLAALSLKKKEALFGNARFANQREIAKEKLYGSSGILLGKHKGKFLRADGNEHVLVIAPTRSGKGVGIVLPNLLNWNDSVIVLDIKLENFNATSSFRKKHGQQVFLFNPAEPNGKTHCYNPLDSIPKNPIHRISEIQKIAHFLCPSPLSGDPMWAAEARKLFLAATLYLQDTETPLTLGMVYRFINSITPQELKETIEEQQEILDPSCISNFKNYISMGEKQRSGVKSTLTSKLELFDNPIIDAATSKSDFNFSDIRKKRTSIYVNVTPDNIKLLKPLLNLFFQQCIDQNTKALPNKETEPYKVLMLMDEFAALGQMDIIKNGIAFFAGYNIRLMPIIQSPSQLGDIYGQEAKRSMISNFKYRIIFAPNDSKVAQEISLELGTKTVTQKSTSQSGFGQRKTITTSKASRPLLLPQEVMQVSRKKQVILIESMPPIMAQKIIHYQDPCFTERFFNEVSPLCNKGTPPISVNKIDLDAAMKSRKITFTKELSKDDEKGNLEEKEMNNSPTENKNEGLNQKLSMDLENLEGIGNKKPSSLLNPKKLSNDEMNALVDEFWNTGTVA